MEKQLLFKRMMLVASLVSTIGLQAGGGNSNLKAQLAQIKAKQETQKNVVSPVVVEQPKKNNSSTTTTNSDEAKSFSALPSLSLPSFPSLRFPTLIEGGVATGSALGLGALAKYTSVFSTTWNKIGSVAGYVRDGAVSAWNGFTLPSKGLEVAAAYFPGTAAAMAKFAVENPLTVSRTILGTEIVAGALAAYGAYRLYTAPKAATPVENLEACRLALKEEFLKAHGMLALGQQGDNKSMKNANTLFANIENRFAKNDESLRFTLKSVVSSLRDAYNTCKNNIQKMNDDKAAGKTTKAVHRVLFVHAYGQADAKIGGLVKQAQAVVIQAQQDELKKKHEAEEIANKAKQEADAKAKEVKKA